MQLHCHWRAQKCEELGTHRYLEMLAYEILCLHTDTQLLDHLSKSEYPEVRKSPK